MKKTAFIFSILTMLSFPLLADTIVSNASDNMATFEAGNELYKNDDYQGSLREYEAILSSGMESAELYFNMGNAYFKLGDLPNAILHYEKAKKLSPDDEDIRTNLEIANLKTVDKVEAKPELPIAEWWKEVLNSNLIDEWANKSIYISFVALLIMIVFLFTSGIVKRISFFTGMAVFALSIVFYFLGQQQKSLQMNNKYGIVFSPSVTVKSSPENDGTRLFVIHEGTKVEVLDNDGEWSEISLMNGNKGWILSESYKNI